jgi:hypothetical protein
MFNKIRPKITTIAATVQPEQNNNSSSGLEN